MKKILVIYATNSGGTQFASHIIENVLQKNGYEVIVKKVNDVTIEELGHYDVIVLGSPSWDYKGKEGQVHQDFLPFMEKAKTQQLNNKQFAVFGLGDSSYTYFCGSATNLENFVNSISGKKTGDTLRIDGFYFNEEENSKKVEEWAQHLVQQLN